jgi:GAF domain-containing protein
MRQTLDINQIFQVTTEELRHLLKCDRVVIYACNRSGNRVVAESVAANWQSLASLHREFPDLTDRMLSCDFYSAQLQDNPFSQPLLDRNSDSLALPEIATRPYLCLQDVDATSVSAACRECLRLLQARAYLTVPIYQGNQFLGLLTS